MIEVKRYLDHSHAEVGRGLLEACGIAARVAADNEGGMAPHLTYVSGVRLLVPPADAEAARAILAEVEARPTPRRPHLVDAADFVPPPGPADRAYKAALVGLVVLPVGLHLYSLAYAVAAWRERRRLSDRARRRLVVALVIDLAVLLTAALLLSAYA